MEDDGFKVIAAEFIAPGKMIGNIDWKHRESARAKVNVMIVKRVLNRHGYPTNLQEEAVKTVPARADLMCAERVPIGRR